MTAAEITALRKEFEDAFERKVIIPQENDLKDKINSLNITIKS